jgi:hypothetical protein
MPSKSPRKPRSAGKPKAGGKARQESHGRDARATGTRESPQVLLNCVREELPELINALACLPHIVSASYVLADALRADRRGSRRFLPWEDFDLKDVSDIQHSAVAVAAAVRVRLSQLREKLKVES